MEDLLKDWERKQSLRVMIEEMKDAIDEKVMDLTFIPVDTFSELFTHYGSIEIEKLRAKREEDKKQTRAKELMMLYEGIQLNTEIYGRIRGPACVCV